MEGKTKEIEMKNFKEDLKHVLAGMLPMVVGFMLVNIPLQTVLLHGGLRGIATLISVIIALFMVFVLAGKHIESIDFFHPTTAKAMLINSLTHVLIGIKFLTKNSIAYKTHGAGLLVFSTALLVSFIICAIMWGENILGD